MPTSSGSRRRCSTWTASARGAPRRRRRRRGSARPGSRPLAVRPAKRLRVAVVGVGRRGREHLETIAAMPDHYELAAVCDVAESAARDAAPSVPAYTSLATMLDGERPDALVIATPPDFHHVAVEAAAERGVHMLIETPLAT